MSTQQHIAVIGAGPAGLTAAYELALRGHKVEVFEAGEAVGGMARTFTLWGQRVDLGPHRFFSSDPRVNRLWLEMAGQDYSMVSRLTRIYYKRTFFDYPLKPFNALFGLGLWESLRCMWSYLVARLKPPRDTTHFQGWVTSRFGQRLFGIFFKSYSEKLWGISCDNLDADFATQRIKKLSLLEAVKSALFANRGNTHKTLVDEFAYPRDGAGMVYERMADRFRDLGGVLHFGAPVSGAEPGSVMGNRPRLVLANNEVRSFDHVISTMPLTLLVARMGAPESVQRHAAALAFRNTILVYLEVNGESPFPDQWIYVHSEELQTGRVTNFSNWLSTIKQGQPNTILCLEYWCNDPDPIWREDDARLVELAQQEIEATGLVPPGQVSRGKVVRVPRCYPVYARGYKDHLRPVVDYLRDQHGITAIGRYGSFKYNNQDHSILMGLLAAENLDEGAGHDLWALNTDYEYQESSKITATGLVAD